MGFISKRAQSATIMLTGLALCLAVDLFYFPHAPTFPDEVRFLDTAQRLVQTGEFNIGGDRAFEMPGAALFFSPFIYLFGASAALLPVRIAQAVLLVLQARLISGMAERIFTDRIVALVAMIGVALYPPLVYMQGLALSETLFNTFLIAGFSALYWWRERGFNLDHALLRSCFFFGAATLTKPVLTILPPFLFAAILLCERQETYRAIQVLLISAVAYFAVLTPWWARNYAVLGEFIPLTTGSGVNLYLGNNPGNKTGGVSWTTDVEPERAKQLLAIDDELERDRQSKRAAMDYIRQHPGAFITRAGQKFVRFWNIVPNAESLRSTAAVLVSALSFGPVLIFAMVSVVRNRRLFRVLSPIYLFIAYFTVLHVIVTASVRYRLPLEPFLILLAAEPLARLACAMRRSRSPDVSL